MVRLIVSKAIEKMQSQFQQQQQPGRRTRTPSLAGASSIYSYASTTRTMSRSMKSLRVAWYKRPIVQDAFVTDIQTGSLITAIFSIVSSDQSKSKKTDSSPLMLFFWHAGGESVHGGHGRVRHLLSGADASGRDALRLLHHELPVRLRRQPQRPQQPHRLRALLRTAGCRPLRHVVHAPPSPAQGAALLGFTWIY